MQFKPEVSSQVVGPEGNGVDIDQESALLAENGLEYEALVQWDPQRHRSRWGS